jgi:hypothetical protein
MRFPKTKGIVCSPSNTENHGWCCLERTDISKDMLAPAPDMDLFNANALD